MNPNWLELAFKCPKFLYPIGDVAVRLPSILLGRGHPLHRNEPVLPIFIVGSGRCGSTLLRRILQAGNEVHIPPETYVLGPAIITFLRNRDRPWKTLVRAVLSLFEFHQEFHTFGVSLRPLAGELNDAPKDIRSLALILDRFFCYHGQRTGQRFDRWGDKTPLNSFWLSPIASVFPRARFIHLLRDGADVAYSRLRVGFDSDIRSAGLRWKRSIRAIRRFARESPEACLEVRYEALATTAETVVPQICSFLDLEYTDAMTSALEHTEHMGDVPQLPHHEGVMKPISASSVGSGRRNLSPQERSELHSIIGVDLAQLGYDPLV